MLKITLKFVLWGLECAFTCPEYVTRASSGPYMSCDDPPRPFKILSGSFHVEKSDYLVNFYTFGFGLSPKIGNQIR